jgi:hypothetical protein
MGACKALDKLADHPETLRGVYRATVRRFLACAPWVFISFCIVAVIGPLSVIHSHSGQLDRGDLYVVLSFSSSSSFQEDLDLAGGRVLGPVHAIFSRLITVPPDGHSQLNFAGYRLLPASILADICGISVDLWLQTVRSERKWK